jgi:hypothetical protein
MCGADLSDLEEDKPEDDKSGAKGQRRRKDAVDSGGSEIPIQNQEN